jgi:hypothetical protein
MGVAAEQGDLLSLSSLGRTPQAAIRTLLTAFRHRGWRDYGAALAIVRALENADGSLPIVAAARHVPSDFLARNSVRRRDVEVLLRELSIRYAAKPES